MIERLQKIIARAGIASRRHAEEMITSGLVTVNGATVTELGSKADASRDHIKVSGKLLQSDADRIYVLMHKPAEVVSTMSDPEGRRSLRDLLGGINDRVFPVGRLEYHAAGLVFLTNDGDLANSIIQSHKLTQTYHLKLKSLLTFEEIEKLARATGAQISRLRGADAPWYEVTISEARRDALRNRLFQTGHPVEKMKRVRIGNLALESLPPGGHRMLSPAEVSGLSRALQGDAPVQDIRNPGGKINKPRPRRPLTTNPRHGSPPANGAFRRESGDSFRSPMNARYGGQRQGGHEPGNEPGNERVNARGDERGNDRGNQSSNDTRPPRPGNFRRDAGESSRSPMNPRPGTPRHAGPHNANNDSRPASPGKFRRDVGDFSRSPMNPRQGGNDLQARPGDKRPDAPWKENFRGGSGEPSAPPTNPRFGNSRHGGKDSRPSNAGRFRPESGDASRAPINPRPVGSRNAGPGHAGPHHANNDSQSSRPGDKRPGAPWKENFRGGSGEPSAPPTNPRFGNPRHGGKDSRPPNAGRFRRDAGDSSRSPMNPRPGGSRNAGPRHAGPHHANNDSQSSRPGDKRPRAPWKESFRGRSGEPPSPPANPQFGNSRHGAKESRPPNAGRFRRDSGDASRAPVNPRHGGPRNAGPRHGAKESRPPNAGRFRRDSGDASRAPVNPRHGGPRNAGPRHGAKESRPPNAGRFRRDSGDASRAPVNPRHGGPHNAGPRHGAKDAHSPRPGSFRRDAGGSRPSSNKRPGTSSTKPRDRGNPQAPRK